MDKEEVAMGYIVIKENKDNQEKITINNKFDYLFLISESPKKLHIEKLFDFLSQFGEPTDIEEIKRLTFSRNN